jgi:pSer/pThr/pTyr-binding forkhead associated (FHA) protein
MKCARCSYELHEGELVCPRCGFVDDGRSTAVLSRTSRQRLREEGASITGTNPAVGDKVNLMIRGLRKQLMLNEINNLIVGRTDPGTGGYPDIDLTAYGAEQRGVSRQHLKMNFADGQLTIMDLQSAYGTYLNGVKLEPNEPRVVNDGDEIMLGQLAMRVNFTK